MKTNYILIYVCYTLLYTIILIYNIGVAFNTFLTGISNFMYYIQLQNQSEIIKEMWLYIYV